MTRPPISRTRASVVVLVGAMTLAACGSDTATTSATTADTDAAPTETDAAPTETEVGTSTLAGVEAAQWADNVTIEIGADSFNYQSDGIPNHEIPDQFLVPQEGSFTPPVSVDEVTAVDSSVAVVETPVDIDIPLNPVYSETTTDTNLGTIGVVLSGAQLFNDYEDQERSFVAVDDNFEVDGVSFVDSCNGHPLALNADGTGQGTYHYHGVPYCITDAVDVEGEHSTVLGFLIDGFPFYGPQTSGGVTITSDELDECSGHVEATPEFPDGIYHYHLTEDRSPYTVDCYHGVVESGGEAGGDAAGGPPGGDTGGAPDFSEAAATLGVTAAELEAALGQPPFDLDAAAAAIGVTAAELEAALPAPPGDAAGGPPADGAAPGEDAPVGAGEIAPAADVDADQVALRTTVLESAQWSEGVTISIDGTTVTFESNGLPSHEYLDTYLGDGRDGKFIAGGVEAYDATFQFPLVPTLADAPSSTGNGAIGVAISGAVYFDPYEGDGGDTVANDDNTTIDGIPFIDACGGHPLPNAISYHYHGIPFCITDAVDTPGEHSVLIGYLFDGYPIYGPQDVTGDEATDLDECMGHTGPTPEFDEDTYHYHVSSTANYISECLTGVV